MQLYLLRRMLNEYESSWSLRKLFMSEGREVGLVRQFLQQYESMPDDYTLSTSDLYRLVKIILIKSNNQLIESIAGLFNVDYLRSICIAVNNAGLLDEATFASIYLLEHYPRSLLRSLFCKRHDHPVPLNAEILGAILEITKSAEFSQKEVKKCIRILNDAGCLNIATLNFIASRLQQIHGVAILLKEMHAAGCLHEAGIAALSSAVHVAQIADILKNLRLAKLHVNEDLIKSICENRNLHYLIEITSTLIDANPDLLTPEILSTLMTRDFMFFFRASPTLKLCQRNGILDQQMLLCIFDDNDHFLHSIVEILANEGLLKANRDLIFIFMEDDIDVIRLGQTLRYLSSAKILDQHALNACVNKLQTHKTESSFPAIDFLRFFEIFTQEKLFISKDMLLTILGLPALTLVRLFGLIVLAANSHQLDQQVIESALQRIDATLPVVEQSNFQKLKRKETGKPRSEMVLKPGVRFFAEHSDQYTQGGLGVIKKGYETALSDKPVYAMKLLLRPFANNAKKELKREAKYHRLLGREAFYFINQKNHPGLVMPWLNGKDLYSYTKNKELLQVPVSVRLRCLASGLSDLNILHQHYRVHGDVKSLNFVVDFNNTAMKLIDFGSSHKHKSKRDVEWTAAYRDPHSYGDSFSRDLYAMGIVIMEMFPELYKVVINFELNYSKIKSNYTLEEQAVVNLVDSMMNENPGVRCTSREALLYCNKLIESEGRLTPELLKSIAGATIHSMTPEIEDVFRGCNKLGRKA